jgi:hypothetical protein
MVACMFVAMVVKSQIEGLQSPIYLKSQRTEKSQMVVGF